MTVIHDLSLKLNENHFFIKRDDLIPFSFGGNKARKAIKFFKEIEKGGHDIVVTYGSSSSNHCRVIANLAASNKIGCVIISPEEDYAETLNSKMVEIFGAKIVKTPLDKVSITIDKILNELKLTNNPYFIQGGGHGILGTEAYVEAYKHLTSAGQAGDKDTLCAGGCGCQRKGV